MYGVRVRDCNAETMQGRRFKILENGCTSDPVTISDVTYSDDMSKAYSDAMAFKFPDAEDLWFKCTVAVCMKRMGDDDKGTSADACQTISVRMGDYPPLDGCIVSVSDVFSSCSPRRRSRLVAISGRTGCRRDGRRPAPLHRRFVHRQQSPSTFGRRYTSFTSLSQKTMTH